MIDVDHDLRPLAVATAGIHAVDSGIDQIGKVVPLFGKLARRRHEAVAHLVADLDHIRQNVVLGKGGNGVTRIVEERFHEIGM